MIKHLTKTYLGLNKISYIDRTAILYISIYCIFGLFTLDKFPPVFIDEPWLNEYSYNLLENGYFAYSSFPYRFGDMSFTGDFFHFFNFVSISIFGFNAFAVRLVPLICFIFTLTLTFLLIRRLFNQYAALLIIVVISLNPYLIYMSRIARPESAIISFIMLSVYFFSVHKDDPSNFKHIVLGFLFAFPALLYLYGLVSFFIGIVLITVNMLIKNRMIIKRYLLYMAGAIIPLCIFIYFKLIVNFEVYYRFSYARGAFNDSLGEKLLAYFVAYGSYFDLSMKNPSLYIMTIIIVAASIGILNLFKKDKESFYNYLLLFLSFMMINGFICATSHYSRFYGCYLVFWGLLVLIIPIILMPNKIYSAILILLTCSLFLFQNSIWVNYYKGVDYKSYSNNLTRNIPADSAVLGKINYRLSFPGFRYYATEDAIRFCNAGGSFSDYIEKYDIQYIIYDYAWDHQSRSNNKDHGTDYEETKNYLTSNVVLVDVIEDSYYSNRFGIPSYEHITLPYGKLVDVALAGDISNAKYWTKIYRVK